MFHASARQIGGTMLAGQRKCAKLIQDCGVVEVHFLANQIIALEHED
jgi:hypothetical protein